MPSIMLDLETWGTRAGCGILSIGAAHWNVETGEIISSFYTVISSASCYKLGLEEDDDTKIWWAKQSDDAKAVLKESRQSKISLQQALFNFSIFVELQGGDPLMWANGADFDLPILAHAYSLICVAPPWKFYNSRCYRTMKNLAPHVRIERNDEVEHNALHDAVVQAKHLTKIAKALNITLG